MPRLGRADEPPTTISFADPTEVRLGMRVVTKKVHVRSIMITPLSVLILLELLI
jgi:hypothetical protein